MSRKALKKTKTHIEARSELQKDYCKSIYNHPLTFAIGSPGSGKTYLAVSKAIQYYERGDFDKIILVRPVTPTEKLGYLPGTIEEKMDPYLRPLYDILDEHWGREEVLDCIKHGVIEISPLAYMKGRTFKNSFIILDEAQDATIEQMKMFLTRFGENVKVVVTGDLNQSFDMNNNGLIWAVNKLEKCSLINIVRFKDEHVIRSLLVKEILKYIK